MFRKKKIGLLPYIREDVHGLSPQSGQFFGWEFKKFNIEKQWDYAKGEGVRVAVIDTGCDINHDDLKNNLLEGKNFVEPGKDPIDRNGHGTHVSGTIAAQDNSLGMVGIAPKAKIIPVKALADNGSGSLQNIISAIEWAADIRADFITMSLGCPQPAKELEAVIKYATSKGSIIFCAAGNSGENADIMYPAKYDNTISIGAIDENLERTKFTCSGDTLDFLAPGHNILSCVPNNGYAIMSGTSMSNPFAVGCAALFLSYMKQSGKNISSLRTSQDYIDHFKIKSKSLADPKYRGQKKYEGYGILYPIL